MSGGTLILEIGVEELPSRFVSPALTDLRSTLAALLTASRLDHGAISAMGTPRRLALLAHDVSRAQPDRELTVQGPPRNACFDAEGKPTRVLEGFAAAQGCSADAVRFVETDKGERAMVAVREPGRSALEVLAEILPRVALSPSFPKAMRWGHRRLRYGRPIRWVLALFDDEVVKFSIEDIVSDRVTRGHRFLGQESVEIATAQDYVEVLRAHRVMVAADEREASIRDQVVAAAASLGGRPLHLEELLQENLHLVEWPTAFTGQFAEEFLELPQVVPVTVLRKHQRCFPVVREDGRLLPAFVAVRNGDEFGLDSVRRGNEVVIHGRLRDAAFFFRKDLSRPLSERAADLDRVVFMHGLGSLRERTERLVALCDTASRQLGLPDETRFATRRAAELCKVDLTTSLVIEFTELQGVIGGVYARLSGELDAVSQAIGEHYRPASADDAIPESVPGAILSVVDRIDHCIGVLSLGEAPTGTADPHGIRRRLQGLAAIVVRMALPLDVIAIARECARLYGAGSACVEAYAELQRQRSDAALEVEGIPPDVRAAVLDVPAGRLFQALGVARAIMELDGSAPSLLTAAWRAGTRPANIVAKRTSDRTEVDSALFEHEVEAELLRSVERVVAAGERFDARVAASPLGERGEAVKLAAREALAAFAAEAEVVDRFFDTVMVMVEDDRLRDNRLAMLYRAHLGFTRIACMNRMQRG